MKHLLKLIVVLFSLIADPLNAATFTVINTNDAGVGSLRQAIIDANADITSPRIINFAIGAGVQTIQPTSFYPHIIVNNVLIDGTSQPGWSLNDPQIVIDGSLLPSPGVAEGIISLDAVSSCTIQALVLNNANLVNQFGLLITDNGSVGAHNNSVFGCFVGTDQTGTIARPNRNGIRINAFTPTTSNGNRVGGPLPGQRNLLSGNSNGGLQLLKNVNNTIIQGNYMGTDKTGTVALPNLGFGFASFGSLSALAQEHNIGTIIGGSGAGEGNLISGNSNAGNSLGLVLFFNTYDTIIQGNLIGVDVTGLVPLSNDFGIYCIGTDVSGEGSVDNSLIGGSGAGQGNVVSGNNFQGIYLQNHVINSVIQGNFIGTDASGTVIIPNGASGIQIQGDLNETATNNLIGGTGLNEGNIIVNNGNANPPSYGVLINGNATTPDILNSILGNSIFNNNDNGIELQNNANNNQLPPTILEAQGCNDAVTVMVTAPATPAASNFRIELFNNSIDRNPITEGERFIGAIASVPSGATVTQSFIVPGVTPGSWISGTATNLNNVGGTPGDTSEFSLNTLLATTSVILTADPSTICFGSSSLLTVTLMGMAPFDLLWSDGFMQTTTFLPATRLVSPLVTTTYSVIVTDSANCPSTSNVVTVSVLPEFSIFLTANPQAICPGQSVVLTATFSGTAPFDLTWSDGFVQTVNASPVIRVVSPIVSTVYSVILTDATTCSAMSNSVPVTITQLDVTLVANPPTICFGDSAQLLLTIMNGTAPFTIVWSDGFVQVSAFANVIRNVMPSGSTLYSAQVTDAAGCSGQSPEICLTVQSCTNISFRLNIEGNICVTNSCTNSCNNQ